MVVFNGGEINEEDFQKAFFKQAINDGLARKSNVNNKYMRTIRSAVGAVLKRILISEGEAVRLGLFNPSVADFILGRYADDHISLEAFFMYLDTVSSIENLEILKKNSMLGDAGYTQILEKLGSEKTGLKHLQKNTVYTLKLIRMVIQQISKPSPDIFEAIVALVTAINTVPVAKSCLEDACLVLDFVSTSKKHQKFQKITTKFIDRCLDGNLDHDHLENLFSLARNLDAEFQETALTAIKSDVEEFWKDQIDQNVANDDVLEGYFDPREEGDAFNTTFEYLYDKLSYFDFTEDEISRISEFADIQGQIIANQEALMEGEEDYESWLDSGDRSSQNDDALVDDLFQRE